MCAQPVLSAALRVEHEEELVNLGFACNFVQD